MKKCSKCKKEKDFKEFSKNKDYKSGLSYDCKQCTSEYSKKRYKNSSDKIKLMNKKWFMSRPGKAKEYKLKLNFGITVEYYTALLISQSGLCAICKQPETVRDHRTNKIRDLAVDHNHITDEIRGLLCSSCNKAIGFLKADDGIDLLEKAIKYLKKS